MVDISDKQATARVAVAVARVRMQSTTLERIRRGTVEKGDVISAARLAGIMGAKRTPDVVPLCHPIALASVEVEVRAMTVGVELKATVKTVDRTGVEMEALMAVSAAALTVYDMLKSMDRGMVIEKVMLEHKSGGRSGTWTRSEKGQARLRARRR